MFYASTFCRFGEYTVVIVNMLALDSVRELRLVVEHTIYYQKIIRNCA